MKYLTIRNAVDAPFKAKEIVSNFKESKGRNYDIKKQIIYCNVDPRVEGIILSGDWHLRPLEFIDVIKEIKGRDLLVMIDLPVPFNDFTLAIGQASHIKVNGAGSVEDRDVAILGITGAMLIDYYLYDTEYYVRHIENGEVKVFKIKNYNEEGEDEVE